MCLPTPRLHHAPRAAVALILAGVCCFTTSHAHGQAAAVEHITVVGEELPSAYGAPPGFSRTRFAPITTAYVLPPGSLLAATIYEGDAFRHGRPSHVFTQEIEVGLPHRFG